MSCDVTFSPTEPAAVAIPEHGIEVGLRYWASDQEFPGLDGKPIRLIGQVFLQPEDQDDGERPPRFAGNLYLSFLNCVVGEGGIGCFTGACIYDDDCCDETTLAICDALGGAWQGPGTACPGDTQCRRGSCCVRDVQFPCWDNISEGMCNQFPGGSWSENPCVDEAGIERCRGACCINLGLCLEDKTFKECTLPMPEGQCNIFDGTPGALCQWQGPDTTCQDVDCSHGACCGAGISPTQCWTADGPEDCAADGGHWSGYGKLCSDDGVCAGACCEVIYGDGGQPGQQPGGPGPIIGGFCRDVVDPLVCAFTGGLYLGPGTNCEEDSQLCGVCCVPNIDQSQGFDCLPGISADDCRALCGFPQPPGSTCPTACNVGDMPGCCCKYIYPDCPNLIPPGDIGDPRPAPGEPCHCGWISIECFNVNTFELCNEKGGQWFGHCHGPCPQCCMGRPQGACCCFGSGNECEPGEPFCYEQGDWTCRMEFPEDCICPGGTYHGDHTKCSGNSNSDDLFPAHCFINCAFFHDPIP